MKTECKQAKFEFHQLFQRKVKARFDGGKITSDAGVLLLREVERGTGLIASVVWAAPSRSSSPRKCRTFGSRELGSRTPSR